MSTSLSGLQIGSSFAGLLKMGDNATISGTLRVVSDGLGVDTALQLSTTGVRSTGTLAAAGNASAANLSGTNTGDQTITLTGDVTGTGTGSFAATIGAGKVTNAMLAGNIDLTAKVTGVLPLANGGTNATTAVLARNSLNRGDTNLTDAATIATDASLGNVFNVQITANRAMGAPTNLVAGATYIWRVKQSVGGSNTLSWNSVFKFPAGTAPVLTTTANAVDVISGVSDGTSIFCSFIQDVR